MTGLFSFAGEYLYPFNMPRVADLVELFYGELWNNRNFANADQILDSKIIFRGSLGSELSTREQVIDYVRSVTTALDGYTCTIQDLIANDEKAAAKVLFAGVHVSDFMGYRPTGKKVEWIGTAFFKEEAGKLKEIWVLGDLLALDRQLKDNQGL